MIKNIALRVDADNNIGLGHLIRIKGFIFRNTKYYQRFILITKSKKEIILKNIRHKKVKIYYIKKNNINNKKKIHKILKLENCNLLLSDISYKENLLKKNFFKNYYKFFYKNKIMTVSFDDPRQGIYSNISIIPYPLQKDFLKKAEKSLLLKGAKYVCFNKDLLKSKKKIKIIPKNILIAISGNKNNKISANILKEILSLNLNIKIKLFSIKKINLKYIKFKKRVILIDKVHNINSLLDWADITVVGEGLIRFEAAAKGVPSIFINNVENSKKNLKLINEFLKLGTTLFVNLKNIKKNNFKQNFLNLYKKYSLRKKQSQNGLKKFDLDGANRINKIIYNYYSKKFIS